MFSSSINENHILQDVQQAFNILCNSGFSVVLIKNEKNILSNVFKKLSLETLTLDSADYARKLIMLGLKFRNFQLLLEGQIEI